MSDTPTPRSYPQTLGDIFDAFLSNQGIRSLRVGSPIVSILEAAAQSDMRNSQDIFNLLTSADLDNATGLALSRIGRSERVPKLEVSPANGQVIISDSSFTKISSKLFQGSPAPIVGSVTVSVVDANDFPTSGSIYVGRGTNNYEGPLVYSSKSNIGNHWDLILVSGTTKFHNTSETVILAQGGNRVVGPSSTVRTPQASVANAIEFRTLFSVTLPDGETSVPNVDVVADKAGLIGNVIAGAVREFATSPFNGATVTNPSPFVNGRETESDDEYRERIRSVRASRQLGTTLAIVTAVTGITAFDENKRINSASLVKRFGFPSTLYIDDGTGYEERTDAVAIESLMDDAVGGETHFETTMRPIARAFAITKNTAPFVLRSTDQLTVKVGGVSYTHVFRDDQFHSISNASVFEVVSSINSNPNIPFLARSADSGTKVSLFANSDTNEDVEVVSNVDGTDGNDGLGFPAGINYTMRLYKNDRLLVKDGIVAAVAGLPFAQWNTVTGSQDLELEVDHTPALTFSFVDQDFIDAQTGYATLGRNSPAAWVAVINAKVPGITASENSGRLVLTSNAGPVEKAGVAVVGGSLVTAHFFGLVSAIGAQRDYTLDRNEAQISLSAVLEAGDSLTAGSFATRAFMESDEIGAITLASDAKLWFVVDGDAAIIEHGITPITDITVLVSSAHDFGNLVVVEASTAAFSNVLPQDWVILWDNAIPASLRGIHRVVDASDTEIFIERHESSLTRRSGHRSVGLNPSGSSVGQVLTCGGGTRARSSISWLSPPAGILNTVENYNPNTKMVTAVAPMNHPRAFHTATTLANGKVVVVGGIQDGGTHTGSIETYDPVADTWTLSGVSLTTAVKNHTATLLTDGRILIAGGDAGTPPSVTDSYQIYNPGADTITAPATMVAARSQHCAVKLPDDSVLVSGGIDTAAADLATAERFTPGVDTFAATGSMTTARSAFGMSDVEAVPTKVIAIGNHAGAGSGTNNWELYNVGAGTWSGPTAMNFKFENKPVTKISNGNVVGLDGYLTATPTNYVGFLYDGTTFTELTTSPPSIEDGSTRWDSQYVELKDGVATVKNFVASIGGSWHHSTPWLYQPTGILTVYDAVLDSWDAPDSAVGGPYNLLDIGIAFTRSDGFVQESVIPAGANYTANSLADALNEDLEGATASVYKTTRLRVNTNTYDKGGDIALITENLDADGIQLDPVDHISNLASHVGSVQSQGGELNTPSFEDVLVISQTKGTGHSKLVVTSTAVDVDYALVGLRNWWRGADGSSIYEDQAYIRKRANSNFQFRTRFTEHEAFDFVSTVATREAPVQPWGPLDRAYFAAPYAIGPNSALEVVVDNDITRHFSINMWRTLTPVGTTYAATNTFRDGDASAVSIAETFGLDYDFNDFAVFMSSRAIAFSADAARRMLFRYFRLGPDGDGVRVRFGNPDAADSDLAVKTSMDEDGETNVTIKLKSGSARAITTHTSTHFGRAVPSVSGGGIANIVFVLNLLISSASRTTNVTTATLTLPSGITDNGLPVGANIWVNSNNINFSSGLKQIAAVTATTVDYAEIDADIGATANIGTLSYDSQGEATFQGSSTTVLDFLKFRSLLTPYVFQISSVPGDSHVFVKSGDQPSSMFGTSTTLSWFPQISATPLTVFANSPQTATQVAAAINTLQDADGSTCPIKATEIGTGAGNITQNSPDELDDFDFWYILTDGVNWVKTTTSPLSIAGDYDLEFKNPIEGTLSTNTDWGNEIVHIVPITTPNVVEWLNTPTVSGLFTMADIEESDNSTRVQITTLTAGTGGGIEVQGGLANDVTAPVVGVPLSLGDFFSGSTIAKLDGDGMTTGMWARILNESTLPKLDVLPVGTILNSWNSEGLLSFAGNVVDVVSAPTQLKVAIEKQGRFVAISDMGAAGSASWSNVVAGSWVRLSSPTSPAIAETSAPNLGIFRVVRVGPTSLGGNAGTLYIENEVTIEEFSECIVAVYGPNSVMPGDQLVILSPAWGTANVATWNVTTVGATTATSGDPFTNTTSFVVDVSSRPVTPQGTLAALTTSTASLIYIREGTPTAFVMRIDGITLNQDDGDFLDIRWDKHVDASAISAAAGSVISILDKLAFPLDFASGADGYRFDTGLLREANKVVYGDPADSSTYPGVAAADAHINIQGPLVKRIQVALSIRVKSGLNTQDIANRVRSAVATVVNKTNIGQSIAFSDIIDGARAVVGVVSVTIIAPLYSVGHDQIKVQPYEKSFVLDLAQDVQVSFVGV